MWGKINFGWAAKGDTHNLPRPHPNPQKEKLNPMEVAEATAKIKIKHLNWICLSFNS